MAGVVVTHPLVPPVKGDDAILSAAAPPTLRDEFGPFWRANHNRSDDAVGLLAGERGHHGGGRFGWIGVDGDDPLDQHAPGEQDTIIGSASVRSSGTLATTTARRRGASVSDLSSVRESAAATRSASYSASIGVGAVRQDMGANPTTEARRWRTPPPDRRR